MRKSGILMHITSLPGPYGVGTLGKSAYAFLEFLHKSGQQSWQMLPLTPTGYGDSPYQSCSAYAGNPYLIDLDTLVRQHLLTKEELLGVDWGEDESCVDFGKLYYGRTPILKLAYSRFRNDRALNAFIKKNASWLEDFALYGFEGDPWLCPLVPVGEETEVPGSRDPGGAEAAAGGAYAVLLLRAVYVLQAVERSAEEGRGVWH